jgi:hypothetical protein
MQTLLLAVVILGSLALAGDYSQRTQCCHGCHGYACNSTNCGNACSAGPHCRGCWKGCAK